MAVRIVEIHHADAPGALNTEWLVIENGGDRPFSTKNCSLSVSRRGHKKKTDLARIDPGFVLAPGEKARLVTGSPGKKAHGKTPEDELKSYHLFLGAEVLRGSGTVVTLSLRSMPIATAEYDADAENGIAAPREGK